MREVVAPPSARPVVLVPLHLLKIFPLRRA